MASFEHDQINIVLQFVVGVNEKGIAIIKRMTLSNVRPDLTADEVSQVSQALASLVKHDLFMIDRIVYETLYT